MHNGWTWRMKNAWISKLMCAHARTRTGLDHEKMVNLPRSTSVCVNQTKQKVTGRVLVCAFHTHLKPIGMLVAISSHSSLLALS